MIGTPFQPELAGKTYRDSMKDFPPPATHNIVISSKTQPKKMQGGGHWDGDRVAFIGEIISLWEMHDSASLASRLQVLAKEHGVEVADIDVHER